MYSLLVVDDEKWVRQGLCSTINWESEGIQLVGEADDGEDAWNAITINVPDIIITDIKMPGMDGLALIEKIKDKNIRTKVIIISGYSDFSYAQKAIRCGAYDYVLKPIEESVLLEVVSRCVDELDKENRSHSELEQMSSCIRESLPLARNRFLELTLTGESSYSFGDVENKWRALDIRLDPESIMVGAIKIVDWGKKGTMGKDRHAIRYALGNMAEEIGLRWGAALACPLNNHDDADVAVLYSVPFNDANEMNEQKFLEELKMLIQAADLHLGIQIGVGVSGESSRASLPQAFNDALHASAYAYYDGCGKIHSVRKLPRLPDTMHVYAGPNSSWENRIIHAMKLGDAKLVQQLVEELCEHVKSSQDKYAPLSLYRGLKSLIRNVFHKWEISTPEWSDQLRSHVELQFPASGFSELNDYLVCMFKQCCQEAKSNGNRKRVIELALNYIEQHFTEGIMMNMVAEHHYVNPSYFSKLFHEEMGETFSKYVARLRVEKAKQSLKHSTLKIYEIALQVGYNDFRHFVKIFKEVEGMTPAQYRDQGV